jgi:hypothetical protein
MSANSGQIFYKGALVGKRYSIQRRLGAGSFGELYAGNVSILYSYGYCNK